MKFTKDDMDYEYAFGVCQGELAQAKAEIERLRAALEQIGWMDEFLDADGARAMMNIARKAINQSLNEQ